MRVEVNNTVVTVHWGGTLVELSLETPARAEALREHLGHYRTMRSYMDPDKSPDLKQEPGFLADLARAYYSFLNP